MDNVDIAKEYIDKYNEYIQIEKLLSRITLEEIEEAINSNGVKSLRYSAEIKQILNIKLYKPCEAFVKLQKTGGLNKFLHDKHIEIKETADKLESSFSNNIFYKLALKKFYSRPLAQQFTYHESCQKNFMFGKQILILPTKYSFLEFLSVLVVHKKYIEDKEIDDLSINAEVIRKVNSHSKELLKLFESHEWLKFVTPKNKSALNHMSMLTVEHASKFYPFTLSINHPKAKRELFIQRVTKEYLTRFCDCLCSKEDTPDEYMQASNIKYYHESTDSKDMDFYIIRGHPNQFKKPYFYRRQNYLTSLSNVYIPLLEKVVNIFHNNIEPRRTRDIINNYVEKLKELYDGDSSIHINSRQDYIDSSNSRFYPDRKLRN